ncbi:peptidoglycan-associated lipoprotein Pal [Shimia marina]|uniref:Peptidoglycan-associated lipoprotein n=1 Tax=Shimia marina TaxID=321267 RepID=A0A0P1EQS3_9RHOB|nr:peptidoglycan-associated lipoprotein Pal [Shimia marina]CUH52059.1 Minor outer membrane protein Omp16 [Shimia marina]SFE60708.1 peptidoglycan-associated lipoprotein [Shimia marina]
MKKWTTAAVLSCAVALGACTDADRFGTDSSYGSGTNSGSEGLGSSADPSSIAYFQEAVGDRVLFAVDQSTLSEEGRLVVLAQANWLLANTDYIAVIEGHADEQGTREYNLALGARRASAVQELLIAQGVAGNRIRTVSFGKERPLEVCSEESCYAENRRAVTVLTANVTG